MKVEVSRIGGGNAVLKVSDDEKGVAFDLTKDEAMKLLLDLGAALVEASRKEEFKLSENSTALACCILSPMPKGKIALGYDPEGNVAALFDSPSFPMLMARLDDDQVMRMIDRLKEMVEMKVEDRLPGMIGRPPKRQMN